METLRAAYPEQSEDEQQIHCRLRLANLREAIEQIEERVEALHPADAVHKALQADHHAHPPVKPN